MIIQLIFSAIQALAALIQIITQVKKTYKDVKKLGGKNGAGTDKQKNDSTLREN